MTSDARGSRPRDISRRGFLAGIGATGALPVLGGLPTVLTAGEQHRFAGKSIRILIWPGPEGRTALEHIAKPFEITTGAKVIPDMMGSTSEMVAKVKASRTKPQYDVVFTQTVGGIQLADDGLLEKPDTAKLPNLSRVIPSMRSEANEFGVGYMMWTTALIYSKRVFARPPDTWEVLWDEKHAGKIFIPPPQWAVAMELTAMAARLAGESERNPEPGFKKLAKLKGRVLTFGENPAQIGELFRAGSLHVGGPYAPVMLFEFLSKPEYAMGAALSELREGFFFDLQLMLIPKGHPGDSDVIHAFINYALDATVQGKMAEDVGYGVINQDVVLSSAAREKSYVLTPAQAKKGINLDKKYLATVRGEWIRKYREIFGV